LLGLALNATLGWWWADPLAGLVIVYYGIRGARLPWNRCSFRWKLPVGGQRIR